MNIVKIIVLLQYNLLLFLFIRNSHLYWYNYIQIKNIHQITIRIKLHQNRHITLKI
jgi:hypothetical protein